MESLALRGTIFATKSLSKTGPVLNPFPTSILITFLTKTGSILAPVLAPKPLKSRRRELNAFTLVAVRLLDRLFGVPLAAKTPLGKSTGQEQAALKAPSGRPLGAFWRPSWTPELLGPPGPHLGKHLGRKVYGRAGGVPRVAHRIAQIQIIEAWGG